MITSVSHVTLFVYDQEAALNFYKKLGFIVHTDAMFDEMRWLTMCLPHAKNFELAIILASTDVEKGLVGKQAAGKPFLSLESSDCDQDYQELKNNGVDIVQAPQAMPWGISMMVKDNSGNHIYICQSI